MSARRNEHERCRKQIKETWHRELKRMQEAVGNLRKAKALYVQRQQDWERAKEAAVNAAEVSPHEVAKLDKRKESEKEQKKRNRELAAEGKRPQFMTKREKQNVPHVVGKEDIQDGTVVQG